MSLHLFFHGQLTHLSFSLPGILHRDFTHYAVQALFNSQTFTHPLSSLSPGME